MQAGRLPQGKGGEAVVSLNNGRIGEGDAEARQQHFLDELEAADADDPAEGADAVSQPRQLRLEDVPGTGAPLTQDQGLVKQLLQLYPPVGEGVVRRADAHEWLHPQQGIVIAPLVEKALHNGKVQFIVPQHIQQVHGMSTTRDSSCPGTER